MAIFELGARDRMPTQAGSPEAPDRMLTALVAENATALIGDQVLAVRELQDQAGTQLLALDTRLRPVLIEAVDAPGPEALVRALHHAGTVQRMSQADVAALYPGGVEAFEAELARFGAGGRSAGRVRFGAVRLVLVCTGESGLDPAVLEYLIAGDRLEVLVARPVERARGGPAVEVLPWAEAIGVAGGETAGAPTSQGAMPGEVAPAPDVARSAAVTREPESIPLVGAEASWVPGLSADPAWHGLGEASADGGPGTGEGTSDRVSPTGADGRSRRSSVAARRRAAPSRLTGPMTGPASPTAPEGGVDRSRRPDRAPTVAGATGGAGNPGERVLPPPPVTRRRANSPATGAVSAEEVTQLLSLPADVLPAATALPELAALGAITAAEGVIPELVWLRPRRGQRWVAILRRDGLLELPDGRLFADPGEAAGAAAGSEYPVDGWQMWRFGEDGPTLGEMIAAR